MSLPALRFKNDAGQGFPEWETKKLSDLAKVYDGTHMTPDYKESGVPFYSVEHLTNNNFCDTKYISEEVFERENKRVMLEKGDILMTRIGDIGTQKYISWNVRASFYVSLALIKQSKNINSKYLSHFITAPYFQKELHQRTIHVAFPKKINLGEISECLVNFPSEQEQIKIANFLTAFDEKITQLTQKNGLLTQYKKGVMQQIFSQELRFKDDDGQDFPEWKLNTIAETIDNYGGTALEEFVSVEGSHNFISIGNYEKTGNYFDNGQRIALNDKTKQKLLNKGDLVMVLNDKTQAGDLIGSTLLITENNKFIYNQRSERLVCKSQIVESKYVWHLFNSNKFRKEIFSISQGGTQIYVNFPAVKKLSIPVPSLKEQTKIANFLTVIDDKISDTQTQLQAVKQYKQGLLQQMFV